MPSLQFSRRNGAVRGVLAHDRRGVHALHAGDPIAQTRERARFLFTHGANAFHRARHARNPEKGSGKSRRPMLAPHEAIR
jgi:hypothetical protein